jgi:hypothetical protein
MVDSSQTRLAYITESTYGTTPATPTFKNQRFVSESLNANIENTVSNEIRADRNVTDLIQVGADGGGSVDFELSYGSFDDWLESLMFSTWSSNILKNGNTQKSFTIEKTFEAGATDQFHRFTGCVANSLKLAIQAKQVVTGSFDFVAKGATTAQAIIASATYTAANSNPVINAAANFASFSMTGVTSPELMSLNLNVTNNLRRQVVVGSLDARGVGTGRFEVTGEAVLYFTNASLYDLFLAGTASNLTFVIGGASTKKYQFDIANLKFDKAEIVAGGNDQDVMAKVSFRGLYDNTDNTLKITRTP